MKGMKSMKKSLAAVAAVAILAAVWPAAAADAVEPQTLNGVSLVRDATTVAITTNIQYTQGASLLFTNIVCYSDAEGTTTQGLDTVTVEVGVGNSTTSTWTTATVTDTDDGTWCATVTLPEFSSVYWQCRLTDAATNVYYYQQQILQAAEHL